MSDITTISNDWGNILQTSCKTSLKKNEYCCVVQMHGSEHTQCFRWFRSNAAVFRLLKIFSSRLQHIWHSYRANIRDQLIENTTIVSVHVLYKMMFSTYKSVIVTPCACSLFVSKVTKITWYMDVRFWRLFFCAFFSVWWLYLEINHSLVAEIICTIYSFIHAHVYTTQHFKFDK